MTVTTAQLATQLLSKHSVLYLRVSTVRQMHTAIDIDPDGNSIATQREACQAKSQTMGAAVQAEFIEPGNSAQSIEKRPEFKKLLRYLEDHRGEIDYVIVYMRSRAFRNSIDAAITKRALAMLGVRIISCKEDFGTGPVADAMEAVSDAFNELQVRQNGEDIKQKLRHKALNGGTISRAKLGYLNIRVEHEGRLFNSIGLDEKRAPLVLNAFELYATGDYSIDRLEATMADLGLATRPSGRHPQEQPVSDSKLHRMLSDPYYAGWVVVEGQLVKGRHEPIVTQALFDQVQDVLAARSKGGSRDRVLYHYLKGMLFCGRCNAQGRTARLVYTEAKGRTGQYYGYYLCRGRQDGVCDLPHLPAWQVEEAIERHYNSLSIPDDFAEAVREQLDAAMADQQKLTTEMHDQLTKQLVKLEAREQRLIDLAADGLLNRSKILERSNAIKTERVRIQAALADISAELEVGAERLRDCLRLVADPVRLYTTAPDETRRQLNATFYQRFYLDDDPLSVVHDELKPPFDEIRDASVTYQRYKELTIGRRPKAAKPVTGQVVMGQTNGRLNLTVEASDDHPTPVLADIFPVSVSSKRVVVEPRGLEPLTSWLQSTFTLSVTVAGLGLNLLLVCLNRLLSGLVVVRCGGQAGLDPLLAKSFHVLQRIDILRSMVMYCFMDDNNSNTNGAPVPVNPKKSSIRLIELGDQVTAQILYALALLGVLLPANTILSHFSQIGFTYSQRRWLLTPALTWHLHAVSFLYAMEGLLAIAVYLYGFDFLLRLRFFHSLGTWFFGAALLTPPIYILLDGIANVFDLTTRTSGFLYYVIAFIGTVLFLVVVLTAEIAVVSRLESND